MSEWKKAREAAAHEVCRSVRVDGCAGCKFNDDPATAVVKGCQAYAGNVLDAALSAFETAGYVLVPMKASEAMVLAGTDSGITDPDGWATCAYEIEQLWPLIVTAALKERQT